MQLIIPHTNTDLDALGAAIGLLQLYPGAEICLPGRASPSAGEFIALHRYNLRFVTPKEIRDRQIERAIVVDTADPVRIGPVAQMIQGAEVHIYDHHPRDASDLTGAFELRELVGAASTLVAERLAAAGARLSPFQATAMLLGIYSDTGSLSLTGTTARDVRAAAYLLEQGASLRAVARFISPRLTPAQSELLQALQGNTEVWEIQGVRVRVLKAEWPEYIGGLALMIHRLQESFPEPAVTVVAHMGDRVHLVGRSQVPWVDMNQTMNRFGGGGHSAAASAVIKGLPLTDALSRLHAALEETVTTPVLARDVMTSPVKVIPPTMTGNKALHLMRRYGHSGLPVVDEQGLLVGILSLRDVETAQRHGLGHAKVGGLMQRQVVTVQPNLPLDEVQQVMIDHDIGRVPVVEGRSVVGIISRSDLLEDLYGGVAPHWHRRLHGDESEGKQPLQIEPEVHELLSVAGKVAAATRMRAYAVGGFVRDLLLGHPNHDIDITVEGDGLQYAQALAIALGGRVEAVPRFGTAHIYWQPTSDKLPGRLDIATARKEFYTAPAALPQVEAADLKEDLYRRDFTVNALALRLEESGPGQLVDFFGGLADLKEQKVRILHSLSFVEDPTRIVRAVRFIHRYGFALEEQTLEAAQKAVAEGYLERLTAERARTEIILLMQEPKAGGALALLAELGALERLLPGIGWSERMRGWLDGLEGLQEQRPDLWVLTVPWRLRLLGVLLTGHDGAPPADLGHRLRLTKEDRTVLEKVGVRWSETISALESAQGRPSRVVAALKEMPPEGLLLLWYAGWTEAVRSYWDCWRQVSLTITGHDLKGAGLAPGPLIGRVLERVLANKLDGAVMDREDEIARALAYAQEEAQQ